MTRDVHEEIVGFEDDAPEAAQNESADVATSPASYGEETVAPAGYGDETIAPTDDDLDTKEQFDEQAATIRQSGQTAEQTGSRKTRPTRRAKSRRSTRGARTTERRTSSSRSGRRADTHRDGSDRLPKVGDRVHHYEIIRELGRGGMGVVCLARDLRLARRVAIKFIRTASPALKNRFLAEARTTAQCHHENIVIIHDIDEWEGNPFMVLEFMAGKSLQELLDGQAVSPPRAIELMIPVARALERAHEFGIVHRDLKPANIFVTDTGIVKVLDFGIAKHRSQEEVSSAQSSIADLTKGHSMTRTGALIGTLPYMSPEQMKGSDVDHRSDLWAMGLILYETVMGQHPLAPFSPQKLQSIADLNKPMLSESEPLPSSASKLGSLIERCLIKPKQDRISAASELREALEALAPSRGKLVLDEDESLFSGLAAFQESEADRFFGRSQEIANVVAQLQNRPLVTLVGPSGAGKSSLVRAGVIPALKRSGEGWHSMVIRPGRTPLTAATNLLATLASEMSTAASMGTETLDGALASIMDGDGDALATRLQDQPGYMGQALRSWARRKKRRLVLLVDQFEELYTLGADAAERTAFVKCLEGAADDASSPLRVVLSIRSDFLDRVVEDSTFMTEVTRGLILLPQMGRSGLREALIKPVEAAGYRLENDELVDVMLDALESTPGALPLLQFTATKLWETRDRKQRILTRKSYDDFGGVAGTLASHADSVLASMPATKQTLARALFQRLVTPERTRAIATLNELRELPGKPDYIEQVVYLLADSRLLAIENSSDGASSVEIIHESLIASWPTLRHWLDEDQDDAEFLARLRSAATEWDKCGRADGALWRGEPMREAQRWHERYQGELPRRESAYLDAVFALAGRTSRRKRLAVYGIMTTLVLLLAAATLALLQIRAAETVAKKNEREARQKSVELDEALQSETEQKLAAERAKEAVEKARNEAVAANQKLTVALEQVKQSEAAARASEVTARKSEAAARASESRAKASEAQAKLAEADARAKEKLAEDRRKEAEAERRKAREEALAKQRLIDRAVGPVKTKIR